MGIINTTLKKSLAVLILPFLMVSMAVAQELTPERYINLEIAVRSITLEEVRERATGNETDTNFQQLIRKQYQLFDVSAGSHLKYGNKNAKSVAQWLQDNPGKQIELDNLSNEFNRLILISK